MSSISTDGDGILVTVRRSKTNQEGAVNDVRFVKGGVARALRTLRAAYDLAGLSFITGSESKQPAGPNAHPLVVRHQPCSAAAVR